MPFLLIRLMLIRFCDPLCLMKGGKKAAQPEGVVSGVPTRAKPAPSLSLVPPVLSDHGPALVKDCEDQCSSTSSLEINRPLQKFGRSSYINYCTVHTYMCMFVILTGIVLQLYIY